jgi:hypothetical protein
VKLISHISLIEQIPYRAKKATAIETIDLPPPSTLRLPEGTLLNLFRHGEEPYPVLLIRAFEDKDSLLSMPTLDTRGAAGSRAQEHW